MTTEATAPPATADAPTWPTAPELDPKYDGEYLGKYPTIIPATGTAEDEKGYAGHLNDMQKAQLFQLRSMLEAEGYKDRLDTLTMVGSFGCILSLHVANSWAVAVPACPQVRCQPC